MSRNGLDWTRRLPELGLLMAQLPVKEAIIDGELCHVLLTGATSFSALKTDLGDKHTDGLVFFAFDLLYLNGYRLHEATLVARKTLLEWILMSPPDHRIRYSAHQAGNGPEFFADAAAMHLEGIVSKLAIGKYRSGRGSNWLKVKALGREELVVVGYTDPENSRVGFGALLVGYYNPAGMLTYAGKVGTGYSDKLLLRLRRQLNAIEDLAPTVTLPRGITHTGVHWVRPEIVIETSFTEWTPDGILRHPSFLGLREDKAPREVVLSPGAKSMHGKERETDKR